MDRYGAEHDQDHERHHGGGEHPVPVGAVESLEHHAGEPEEEERGDEGGGFRCARWWSCGPGGASGWSSSCSPGGQEQVRRRYPRLRVPVRSVTVTHVPSGWR